MTTYPRGKPASPARPGKIIKEVLLGKRPLVTGDLVEEAAIVDLCNVYKDFIYNENLLRPAKSKLKGMVYSSFLRLFKFAQLLGLVELVREEPMLFPPGSKHLYSVRKRETDGVRVFATISKRRIFKLTSIGREDDRSWTDLCRAWREGWHAPEKIIEPVVVEEEIPTVVPIGVSLPPKARKKPRAEKVEVPTLKLQIRPTKEQYILLLDHLHKLNVIGIDNEKVQREVDRLANKVGEWVAEAIEAREDATAIEAKSKAIEYRHLETVLTAVDEGLLDRDIPRAIEHLEKLVTGYVAPIPKAVIPPKPTPIQPPESKPDIDELRSELSELMDEDKKAASIKKLEKALAGLDYDKYTGLDDIESAVEEYREAEREDKESAFEEIVSAIDSIELVEEEEE